MGVTLDESTTNKKRQSFSGCCGPAKPSSQTLFPPLSPGLIFTPKVVEGNRQLPGSLSSSGTLLIPSSRMWALKPDALSSPLGSALTNWVMLHRLPQIFIFLMCKIGTLTLHVLFIQPILRKQLPWTRHIISFLQILTSLTLMITL